MIISVIMLVASWFKRFLIVVPTQENPFLPRQFVPDSWMFYQPTIIESAITIGTILLVVMIISVLVKLFPVISIWEMAEELSEKTDETQNKLT